MKRRITITHVKSGLSWYSEWEDANDEIKNSSAIELDDKLSIVLRNGNTTTAIPPDILKESIRFSEYKEE